MAAASLAQLVRMAMDLEQTAAPGSQA
jgi:hypothetical protein